MQPSPRPSESSRSGAALEENLEACSKTELWTGWFAEAEASMDEQWRDPIWPLIKRADFSSTLEVGPGAGRNAEKLVERAEALHLVDLNDYALARCRSRFRDHRGRCEIHYHRNDGQSLSFLEDDSISFVYSWDSMVHFERSVVARYVEEFARVMRPGATGFVHFSNFGTVSQDPDIEKAPHLRSNMTEELFGEYCRSAGLRVSYSLVFDWGGVEGLDCLATFYKPDPDRKLATWLARAVDRYARTVWLATRGRAR